MDIKNLSIVRQSFANAAFTHKVQEIAAESKEKKATCVKITNIIFVGLVLVMLVIQTAYPTNPIFSYIGSGIAVGEIIFLIVQLSFNFEQGTVLHKNAALQYMQLRDKYRTLIVDIMNNHEIKSVLVSRRDALQAEYQVVSSLSPQTGSAEYKEAQRRLNTTGNVGGEQFTWSDEEIDQYLPENLRLTK